MDINLASVRAEQPVDAEAIRRVHIAAFPTPLEAQLVDDLRAAGRLIVSRVAIVDDQIVGHIAFSPVTLGGVVVGLGLAPLAVIPQLHRRSIGSSLVRDGLQRCAATGTRMVVVLGSPVFYGRFGFKPAANWNLADEYQGGEAFQAVELIPGAIPVGGGLVQYAPEFSIFAA